MQDYGKATYRCLNMFAESVDKKQKMKYLEKAEVIHIKYNKYKYKIL